MDRVDVKYASRRISRTASFVERARPEENAILARTVSSGRWEEVLEWMESGEEEGAKW